MPFKTDMHRNEPFKFLLNSTFCQFVWYFCFYTIIIIIVFTMAILFLVKSHQRSYSPITGIVCNKGFGLRNLSLNLLYVEVIDKLPL